MEAATSAEPKVARVYICSSGHRTLSLWSVPTTCNNLVRGHVCGRDVVPLAQVLHQQRSVVRNAAAKWKGWADNHKFHCVLKLT